VRGILLCGGALSDTDERTSDPAVCLDEHLSAIYTDGIFIGCVVRRTDYSPRDLYLRARNPYQVAWWTRTNFLMSEAT
jgi:hypothetical protein